MIWWVLLLFVGGMVLILAEFVLPGGVAGVIGALLLVASMALGVYAYPGQAVFIIVGEIVAALGVIVFGVLVVSKSGLAKGLRLDLSQYAEEGYVNLPTDESLVGAIGTVYTALRPAGTIVVDDQRIDAVSDGVFIGRDARVRVVEVHGNRVVVEPVEETAGLVDG